MHLLRRSPVYLAAAAAALAAFPLYAQEDGASFAVQPTYVDLVELAEGTPAVVRAEIRRQVMVEPERAPGLAPGFARLYIEARTLALLGGNVPLGESLRYLVDVPLEANGKPPKLKKSEVLLFARTVPGRPGELQLVDPTAQLPYTPQLAERVRNVLGELASTDRPPVVTEIRDAMSIAGTLVGESETQLFLDTRDDGPVSITVVRRPGQAPRWGVSWTDIVDQSARPPAPETLAWYRLACALPERLPAQAILSRDPADRTRAAEDYALVRARLGACERNRS